MFGKECIQENKYTYLYKGEIPIPPLSMVDDIVCITECGYQSARMNSFLNCKTSTKKLQFGASKCKKMHIGKKHEDFKCHPLYVDNWEEKENKNELGKDIIEDICVGKVCMEEADEEKYLGDIVSKDGRNLKNIKTRVNKGKGIAKRILDILEGIPFGKLYFQVAIILRNSLLVSSVMCNSETWFSVTKSELELLETADLMLLRSILGTPKTVPKELLYLELGILPMRDVIRQRRLNFLHYILNQGSETMLFRVFEKQCKDRNKKDWVSNVLADLEELGLNVTFATIQQTCKVNWKNMVKNIIKEKAFRRLETMKQTHSKAKFLKYQKLEMQDYLMPNDIEKITKEEVQLIFKMRGNITNLKMNMKNQYESFECEVCESEDENQKHVYECKKIWELKNEKKGHLQKYEDIMTGNVKDKIKIARIFKENMKIHEEFKISK